jgi:23S rRNA G2445 N2-methylase RlmL
MKFIAICAKGLEDVTQKEIKEILKVASKIVAPGRVRFTSSSVSKLVAKTQSIIKIYELKQECQNLKEIKTFTVSNPFKVESSITNNNHYVSLETERDIGEIFYNQGYKVDLKTPKTIVFVDIIGDKIFVGKDLTPVLLSKREYRIKIHNQGINACIGYGLVRLSEFSSKKKKLLDPFAKDGIIAIEAARHRKGKIYAIESLFSDTKNIEINSTLARVRRDLNVSRLEIDWLDSKFGKGAIDCLVSAVPYPSKNCSEKEVGKVYRELFYQLEFIMKKNGKVVLIAPTLELLKKFIENFKIIEERKVSTSNFMYDVIVLRR